MQKTYALLASAAVVALIGTTWWITSRDRVCGASAVAGGNAAIGGPFTLVNGQGVTVTDKDVLSKPSLVYFGYTYCPDICPMDVARNAEAVDLLTAAGRDVQPVFISIDPKRDTPEVVEEYARYMHPDMIALTGSPEQVKAASKAYKTFYSYEDSEDEFYLVNHSTFTYLMLPGTGFVEFFKRADTPEDIAERTACYIDTV